MTTTIMKPVIEEKTKEVEQLKTLIKQYKAIGIANLQKVRATQLQELKKKLRNKVHIQVIKNTITRRAIKETKDKTGIEKLEPHLTGSNILLLTNLNPFKLAFLLEQSKVKITAKTGDIAATDIIIPAGNTGLPPGPIISQLSAVGLPTRIESGSVWINKDTLVAKKGEPINERLASVLSKLGIKPVEAGISLKAIYDDGIILTQDLLHIDLDNVKKEIQTAHSYAFNLSISAAYPAKEITPLILQKAHFDAYTLAIKSSIPTKETIKDLLRKAYLEMTTLNNIITQKT